EQLVIATRKQPRDISTRRHCESCLQMPEICGVIGNAQWLKQHSKCHWYAPIHIPKSIANAFTSAYSYQKHMSISKQHVRRTTHGLDNSPTVSERDQRTTQPTT